MMQTHMRNVLLIIGLLVLVVGTYVFVSRPEPTSAYPEIQQLAAETEWEFQDFARYFRNLSEEKGAAYAFDVLIRAELPHDIDTHLLGHIVGDMLYRQEGIPGVKKCTDDLRNACSHSVVIGILLEHGEGTLPTIAETCKEAPGGRGAYTMCFHGLGHGVLAYTGYDFEKAVAMCGKTGTAQYDNAEYFECVGGAMMEMVAGIHDPEAWKRQVGNYFRKDDPLYPCSASFVPDRVKPACFAYLTPHLYTAAGIDLENVNPGESAPAFALCDAIPTTRAEIRAACYGGFGKEFIGFSGGRDIRDVGSMTADELSRIRQWCRIAGNPTDIASCNAAVLSSLFWGGEANPDAAFTFCDIAEEGSEKDVCYEELGEAITFFFEGTSRKAALCGRLPEEFRRACLK